MRILCRFRVAAGGERDGAETEEEEQTHAVTISVDPAGAFWRGAGIR